MNRIFSVPGVATIEQLDIYLDSNKQEKCQDVSLNRHALLHLTEPDLTVHYSDAEESA